MKAKKIIILIIGIVLVVAGLVGWQAATYSQSNRPYSDPDKDDSDTLTACTKTVANAIYDMRGKWIGNLIQLLDQEKPTSEMVDEAFQSHGTYRCWLGYLCEAVVYSGNADPNITQSGDASFRPELDGIPGCAPPYKVQIPDLKYLTIPACKVIEGDTNEFVAQVNKNYSKCRELVGNDLMGSYAALEDSLRKNSADQKIRPLREKFSSILLGMLAMENHMTTLKEQILSLDARTPCYCAKCD